MTVLLIGLGSIAKKHIRALKTIDKNIRITALDTVSKTDEDIEGGKTISSFDQLKEPPGFILISNPTKFHETTIRQALRFQVPLFIEKPPLMDLSGYVSLSADIENLGITTYVGYNMRFHPIIRFLKEHVTADQIIEANIYCGSYLPEWRPDVDYRQSYSARSETGGGVHLDLIHEIDYTYWLLGAPAATSKITKKVSNLEINSMDYAHYQLDYLTFAANITLNYYRRQKKREIEFIFNNGIWNADLLTGEIHDHTGKMIFQSKPDIAQTYVDQMRYFIRGMQHPDQPMMNNFQEAVNVLKICLHE